MYLSPILQGVAIKITESRYVINTVRIVARPAPSNESRNFNGEIKSTFLKP